MTTRILFLFLPLVLLGCPQAAKTKTAAKTVVSKSPGLATPARDLSATYPVVCGCKLPIKKCSEWAEVDGVHVRLKGDLGLKGSMPFCGKKGLKAEIKGKLEGETLSVSSFKLTQ